MRTDKDDELPGQGSEAVTRGPEKNPETRSNTDSPPSRPREIGGRQGPEPTRFGDWEKNGRCIDF